MIWSFLFVLAILALPFLVAWLTYREEKEQRAKSHNSV
jgi:hypothetical protein